MPGGADRTSLLLFRPVFAGLGGCGHGYRVQQRSAERELFPSSAVSEKSILPDADKAGRQNVQQKSPDELGCRQSHDLRLASVGVVFPLEGHLAVFDRLDAAVGDGDAMGITRQILQDLFRPAEGWLYEDDPLRLCGSTAKSLEYGGLFSPAISPWNCSLPSVKAFLRYAMKTFRNRTLRTRFGSRNELLRHGIQRLPSGLSPPPGTTQCRCG